MTTRRPQLPPKVEAEVLVNSRRRCCLCYFLDGRRKRRKGQVAHLNRDRADHKLENLVWLCFDHHDEYDSRTSQSKGLKEREVRHWRDELVVELAHAPGPALQALSPEATVRAVEDTSNFAGAGKPWRFPLWLVEDRLELFAFKAGTSDGVCFIERIDLPNGRTVVACVQAPGNPGSSITNSVEDIASQVCERFEIAPAQLVWLEHYPHVRPSHWNRVLFGNVTQDGGFEDPSWTRMDERAWRGLSLRPKRSLRTRDGSVSSPLIKLFPRKGPSNAVEDG